MYVRVVTNRPKSKPQCTVAVVGVVRSYVARVVQRRCRDRSGQENEESFLFSISLENMWIIMRETHRRQCLNA